MYRVTCSEDPDNPIVKDASSSAWIEVFKRINDIQGISRLKVTVSGPDRYGISEPAVTQLISSMPNASNCHKFRPPNGWEVVDD